MGLRGRGGEYIVRSTSFFSLCGGWRERERHTHTATSTSIERTCTHIVQREISKKSKISNLPILEIVIFFSLRERERESREIYRTNEILDKKSMN